MVKRSNRPPRRICRGCGGEHYAWSESAVCVSCKPSLIEGSRAVAAEVRRQREGRRQEQLDSLSPSSPPAAGVLSEEFGF